MPPESRSILPVPDRPHVGLTTFDTEDPDTAFPPIEPLRPPAGTLGFEAGSPVTDDYTIAT